MLKWLGVRTEEQCRGAGADDGCAVTTDDPLAAITPPAKQIYSVSRSVHLPRVALRNGLGINPIFVDNLDCTTLPHKPTQLKHPPAAVHHAQETSDSPPAAAPPDKTPSSGYGSHGGSSHDPTYGDNVRLREDAVAILEQNANFVKSILVAVKNKSKKSRRSVGSLGSSAAGTLSTIPEGKVDFTIPRPVWPKHDKKSIENLYDSLVDESLLLYTSLSYVPENETAVAQRVSAKEILKELSDTINAAVTGKTGLAPEQVLKCINDRLASGLEILQQSTEEDMRKLSVNLSNSGHLNTVIRAFSNTSCSTSSSGHSSGKGSPEWGGSNSSRRLRTEDIEEIYQMPSGSSSSGFSDKNIYETSACSQLPVFVHEDLASVPNGVRNAMIYGTLCRGAAGAGSAGANVKSTNCGGGSSSTGGAGAASANERLLAKGQKNSVTVTSVKGSLLAASPDAKPSVWEIYYGASVLDADGQMKSKSTDTAYFPAGRPEADFTLDVPRSELLMRKMKAAKKWRFRCRIVTSFLGLVFFLLSLMAVSLMLTRGKRMFGSMV